ncbi:hypothetical protein ILUMI_03962 [Ignelater luminosus]|uniref:Uncharacterized protein n=1 Tax=Ignelater luminosus TaxID=2038154 RepID=A0A8K0DFM0_IGNLU|nr:hypothetical protein ILUMI_03962 [Ignelater luminosus]
MNRNNPKQRTKGCTQMTSVIAPVPETSMPTKPAEYRPINLLPAIDRVLDIVACKQLHKSGVVNTLLAVPKIVAQKDASERGEQVTFVGIVTASGEAFPPVYKNDDDVERGQYSVQEGSHKIEDSSEATDLPSTTSLTVQITPGMDETSDEKELC